MNHRRIFSFAAGLWLCASPLWARYPAVLSSTYDGQFSAECTDVRERVRILVPIAQLEISSQLGLMQYREGFRYPMTISCGDAGDHPVFEHARGYCRISHSGGGFAQELVINVGYRFHDESDLDQLFYHEMTHAVLNDAVGAEASKNIPPWVQEGLAQMIAGQGEFRVTEAAQRYRRREVQVLLHDMDSPFTGAGYPQYYLDIKCIKEKHTLNAVQSLVRLLIEGKSLREAVDYSVSMPWDQFQTEVRDYSLEIFQDRARPDY